MFNILRPLIFKFSPEVAHSLAIKALKLNNIPYSKPKDNHILETTFCEKKLSSPIGVAAGFDKNAEVYNPLFNLGFGFVEVGTITPKPQFGNPKPRVFRLEKEEALINRLGFNNHGSEIISKRIAENLPSGFLGINVGPNKETQNKEEDYFLCLSRLGTQAGYLTINISSPNTKGLRDFQEEKSLSELLSCISETRENLKRPIPIFLKIAPDLARNDLETIAEVAVAHKIDAIIATNTTLDRKGINNVYREVAGGLSGKPLFEKSTRVLAIMSDTLGGRIPLIGVGGISCGSDAYQKICAGASAVQLYTALIYQGFSLIGRIATELDKCLEGGGFENVSEAVGSQA